MLEMGGTSSANRLCVYISKTDSPISGGWNFYGFATPALPDYPHCPRLPHPRKCAARWKMQLAHLRICAKEAVIKICLKSPKPLPA